jgi:hypothetical protein
MKHSLMCSMDAIIYGKEVIRGSFIGGFKEILLYGQPQCPHWRDHRRFDLHALRKVLYTFKNSHMFHGGYLEGLTPFWRSSLISYRDVLPWIPTCPSLKEI